MQRIFDYLKNKFSKNQSVNREEDRLRPMQIGALQKGHTLGKPKGTLQKSKFDAHVEKIKELLSYGLSFRKIVKVLVYQSHIALMTYVNKRRLREKLA